MSSHASSAYTSFLEQTASCASGKERVDRYLSVLFPELNRSQLQRALRDGRVSVNGRVILKKQGILSGDVIRILLQPEPSAVPHAVPIPLDVRYEDEFIIVVNKPAGMVTHPGSGTGDDTLVHALLHHCNGQLSMLNGEDRPGIAHRLDKDTSGLLVAAKTDDALRTLIESFRNRQPDKRYLAICSGVPSTQSGICDGAISRHPVHRLRMAVLAQGKAAQTDWQLLAQSDNGQFCLLECKIHTGRTHQIRVHLSHMGHCIVGDRLYGFRPGNLKHLNLLVERPLLHSWSLSLKHPSSGEWLSFCAAPPDDFSPWIAALNLRDRDLAVRLSSRE